MSIPSLRLLTAVAIPVALGAKVVYTSNLKGASNHTHGLQSAPCHCKIDSPDWVLPKRTAAKCIFIDLGASSGNDLQAFSEDKYGPLKGCPNGDWEAILVEANPSFKSGLEEKASKFPGKVTLKAGTAAYMCEAKATFYFSTKDVDSLEGRMEVETLNINRLLTEHTIPGDYVIMKMDIEGAEFDIVPCMAEASAASLVDRLYVSQHDPAWGLEGAPLSSMQTSLAGLRTRGIDIPASDPVASVNPY
eukprot:TRINITY_DN102494_c0_g1_i1.p1 TRINITY_DN102494_c0_g1~~TRINITY_DN102494_c0_g1_i1.p1  ORF type:complete len:247 (+),score=39.11 TRINITY_DN102494_c0_g1_i1:110-850(+)